MIAALYIVGPIVLVAVLIFIAYLVTVLTKHKEKITKDSVAAKTTSKTSQMFDAIPMIMGEINKMGEEQKKALESIGVTDAAQQEKILAPVRQRYNQLKFLQENRGLALPLIDFGEKTLGNLLKGFGKGLI